jgi:hypothetical protein
MIRVIVNGVSFYTTKSAIRNRRVGDNTNLNEALALVFADLHNGIGIGTTMHIYDSKMRKHTYDIQINV